MRYIDFHTHQNPDGQDVFAVVDGRDTWGVHPWDSLPRPLQRMGESRHLIVPPSLGGVLALGECGLDGLRGPAMEVQEEVFVEHVRLGEELKKPLIIHCVKAFDRLLRLRREQRPTMPWMLHGFRGKPQQLRSLLDAGFYVSFGFRHNEESLRLCPLERLMLETDDDMRHISILYNNVATVRGISLATLCETMAKNYVAFFHKKPLIA